MMRNITKITKLFRPRRISLGLIVSFAIASILIVPAFSSALAPGETSLVPCGTQTKVYQKGDTLPTGDKAVANDTTLVTNPCGFNDVIKLINNVIHFILFYLVIPIVAIMFAYAGFLLITAGGEAAGARTKAKNIFLNAVIGLVIAVAAWLIVKLILSTLGYTGINTFFN